MEGDAMVKNGEVDLCGDELDGKLVGQWVVVEKEVSCDSCGKPVMSGEVARVSGFGGYNNPVYFYVCENCNEKSEQAYQSSCLSVEMRELELAEMEY